MKHSEEREVTRRRFVGALGAAGAAAAVLGGGRAAASGTPEEEAVFLDRAPDGPPLRAGLVGCGGRGTGAALNFLDAGPNLEITALADVFEDRLQGCRKKLEQKKGVEVPDERCFLGFDAYERLIGSGVDVVILATPPHFRPQHFRAAVNARKHVFMEKPVAVDPVGARSVMATARKAQAVGLCVVTGTQRRHQRGYVAAFRKVREGAIGRLTAAYCWWNMGQLWYRERQEGWSDMEYMIRDWVNWCWLSGDHIVEQHVHNLDVINWFKGDHPVKAVGFGGRHRRVTGDQYDFFSVDYVYPDGMRLHSMCRQIDGCANKVGELLVGTAGSTDCRDRIWKPDGATAWKYSGAASNPYVQEHVVLVTAVRTDRPVNNGEQTAVSTLTAIMGRISAYTGAEVTWEEMMESPLRLGPRTYALGPVEMKAEAPVPGKG